MMINDKMPEYTVKRLSDLLNKQKKSLNGAKILQLGVAYKNDIDDYRESPALVVRELMDAETDPKVYNARRDRDRDRTPGIRKVLFWRRQ